MVVVVRTREYTSEHTNADNTKPSCGFTMKTSKSQRLLLKRVPVSRTLIVASTR